jgi:signal transduction histidine kinase
MRVTLKLSLAIGLCILVVLGVNGVQRVRSDVDLTRREVRVDHVVLGRVLGTGVELLLERNDLERARELVSAVNAREHQVQIRWLEGAGDEPAAGPHVGQVLADGVQRSEVLRIGDVDALVTYVPVVGLPGGRTAIEIVEPLVGEAERVRATVLRTLLTTSVLMVACLLALLGFGVLFVGRPVARLRDHARRVGQGELRARLAWRGSDELGDLAEEMDAMTERLAAARDRAAEEAAARAKTLERLRHADRLRAVGEMASAVAHEVGTPLATIRARLQQLERGDLSEERARQVAGIALDEVDRLSRIIRRLLEVSRRETEDVRRIDVAEWARDTLALLEPLARGANVELVLEESAGTFELDAGRMRQVAINLLMNAIQASPRGAQVRVRVWVEDGRLFLRVDDAGPGVPPELRKEIFEPFFTTKKTGEGTGLGLSVTAGIVREQGGTISVTDHEGPGARFEVSIPARADPLRKDASTRRAVARPTGGGGV